MTSVVISQSLSIYRRTNNAWIEETNSNIAYAQGSNPWNTNGYITLDNSYTLPKIYLSTEISQWIFVSIQYLNYYIHVNMPGDYTAGLTVQVETNGGVYAYLRTGGWLGGIVPAWIGYKIDDPSAPSYGLPANNSNNNFWYDMKWINDNIGNQSQKITVQQGSHIFYGWLGFRIDKATPKGEYVTYLDIYIQSDP